MSQWTDKLRSTSLQHGYKWNQGFQILWSCPKIEIPIISIKSSEWLHWGKIKEAVTRSPKLKNYFSYLSMNVHSKFEVNTNKQKAVTTHDLCGLEANLINNLVPIMWKQTELGLRCSTGGPEHPHVGACCGRGRERSMTCVAVHGINFTSHWTFDVNGTEVVKQSLLPVASRWRHQYCYLQTNISVQVGALM